MSYVSATTVGNRVLVWERDPKTDKRIEKWYPAPFYFYIDDEHGEHTTIFDTKVSKVSFDSFWDYRNAKQDYERNKFRTGITAWESDIKPEMRVLSEHYYDKPITPLHVTWVDIEVDYDPAVGFSSIENPYAPINSISMYHTWSNTLVLYVVLPKTSPSWYTEDDLLDDMNCIEQIPEHYNLDIQICEDEEDLLFKTIMSIQDTDVWCGYNSEMFDFPYIAKRLEIVFGDEGLTLMNFPKAPKPYYREVEVFGRPQQKVIMTGRVLTDYMQLIKKFEPGERSSFKLSAMEEYYELNLPKMEYEGTLADLYLGNNNSKPDLDNLGEDSPNGLRIREIYREILRQELETRGITAPDTFDVEDREEFKWKDSILSHSDDELIRQYQLVNREVHRLTTALFFRYNIRDSEILQGFEEKLHYVDIAHQYVQMATGLFDQVLGTLALADLTIINRCHHELNLIVPNNRMPEIDRSIEGAFVVESVVGMHDWVAAVDLTSLYPMSIRSVNASPETIVGRFLEEFDASEHILNRTENQTLTFKHKSGKEETRTVLEWVEYCTARKYSVSGYGVVFDQKRPGIIPQVLAEWFNERKRHQKIMRECSAEMDQIMTIAKDRSTGPQLTAEESRRYNELRDQRDEADRSQFIFKIRLNSLYGAVTNQMFRMYALEVGESTTATGRMVSRHQREQINVVLHGKREDLGGAILAGDTDSAYFKLPIPTDSTVDQACEVADEVAQQVNDSFPAFMKRAFLCTDGNENLMSSAREIIAKRVIFVQKKHYMAHVVDDEGKRVEYFKVTGLAIKKTTLPKEIAFEIELLARRLLLGEEWDSVARDCVKLKDKLRAGDITKLGLPRGVNGVEKYTRMWQLDATCRLPGHVSASIYYNNCLRKYNDIISPAITSGMKIRVFYLKQPDGRFKSIAIPVDIEVLPKWLDNIDMDVEAQIERLVDKPFGSIVAAIGKKPPTRQTILIDELVEF